MWGRVYLPTILVFLALQTSLRAQTCDPSRGWRSLRLLWPYTVEYHEEKEYTDDEGRPTPVTEVISLVAQDSQGRRLDRRTGLSGYSHSSVFDPVTGEEIAWNSSSPTAKLLKLPTPVAGRRSCWQGPDSERHVGRDEPQVGWSKYSCPPAGIDQPPNCRDACAAERRVKAPLPEKQGFPPCDRAEPEGTAEDLGIKVIQGLTAHGCRTTTPFPKGKIKLREIWSDEYGLTISRIEEDPTDAKFSQELISLSRGEPDPSSFQQPREYQLVTLEYQEVSCDATKPQSH